MKMFRCFSEFFILLSFTGLCFAQEFGGTPGGVGGFEGGSSDGGFFPTEPGSPTINIPVIEPDLTVIPENPLNPIDIDSGIPRPHVGPDGWLPLGDPSIPPAEPGSSVGYCQAAVCNGDPSNGIPISVPVSNPGISPTVEPQNALAKSNAGFPSVVAVSDRVGQLCTGVIVSSRMVLTAAHCVCDHSPSDIWIGNSVINDDEFSTGQNFSRELVGKPKFFEKKYCSKKRGFDLAAIFLKDEFAVTNPDFHEFIAVMPVDVSKFMGTIVGFGASNTSSLGGVKRQANIEAVGCTTEHVADGEGCISKNEWISFSDTGTDTCRGDSGGPLYMHNEDETLRLVGLTSRKRGGGTSAYCGDGGIYVNLTLETVTNWINDLK